MEHSITTTTFCIEAGHNGLIRHFDKACSAQTSIQIGCYDPASASTYRFGNSDCVVQFFGGHCLVARLEDHIKLWVFAMQEGRAVEQKNVLLEREAGCFRQSFLPGSAQRQPAPQHTSLT